ncbi:tumor necrosis factor receptor superfamily member 4 [Heteronotia binoei]|uniref:tumor necrosis factor receptor superfamily member 4 n=1 Tax=Heteronotia binoei TaxID=13085 RepID=UPI0029313DA1|nr:tumor necrosis factor receptor superfamily member 4 [Heteronotia binoei]
MQDRCTKYADTLCRPCEEGKYNPLFTTWKCQSCAICDPANGLQEVKKCAPTSNSVCVCLPGYKPATSESNEKRCDPCPKGHFSKGGDKTCTAWTNCTATGRQTFREGTKEDDAVCGNTPKVPQATELPIKLSSKREMVKATSVMKPTLKATTTSSALTALSTGSLPGGDKKSGYLSYILIGAALLLVSGGIILLKISRKTRKYKEPGRFMEQMQKDGKNSFRIPIQEEQIDAKSSLAQN